MKHMSALHRQVQAGQFSFAGSAVAMESISSDSIAMEGLGDKLKEGWGAFKKRVMPSDREAVLMKLAYLPKMRAALVEAKTKVSQAKTDAESTKAVQKFTKEMPVTANNADQLIREMGMYTRRIDALINKAVAAKNPDAVKKVRQELALELSKKGNVADGMVFTKQQVLKFLDECIALSDVVIKAGNQYAIQYEAERKAGGITAMESFKSKIAMESLEDVLAVAMESVGGVIVGVFAIIAAIFLRVCACFAFLVMWAAIFTGNILGAIGGAAVGIALVYVSQKMIDEVAGEA